jgi:hypothetical protein
MRLGDRRLAIVLLLAGLPAWGGARRVVIFKFDGLNADLVAKGMAEPDPHTGRPQLPWMQEIFGTDGTRLTNFFVRGISLSAPSWSMLDTGRHDVIRGNVEYDRWTMTPYDYLNFFPFYVNYSENRQVDMPGVEVLDEMGIPLTIDAFPPESRWQSFQLYQRGNAWRVLQQSVPKHFETRTPREWFDEWQTGLSIGSSIPEEEERELIRALADDSVAYLDFFSGDYDHTAHLVNDPQSQMRALQALDALVGRIWTAARAAKLGPETVFALVSDHGMNTSPAILSQGYSLVNWFNGAAGGAQHVITDRYPLSGYKLRGLDPWIHKVVTPSAESFYLKNEGQRYPTVALDVDGNERAGVQLRSNDWNMAQILLEQVGNRHLTAQLRSACRLELERWAETRRAKWISEKARFNQELEALDHAAKNEDAKAAHWTKDLDKRRAYVRVSEMRQEAKDYREFIASMDAFLAMPLSADANLVPKESFGDANSVYDLQNYVVGLAEGGPFPTADGRLDTDRSFRRVDYFAALLNIRVRNQVQAGISNQPVDFIAARLDPPAAEAAFGETGLSGAIWLYAGPEKQAVVLYREAAERLEIRYVPVAHLRMLKNGELQLDRPEWRAGFPLAIFEDAGAQTSWRTDRAWFDLLYKTRYTNGLVGLTELFRPLEGAPSAWARALPSVDCERLVDLAMRRRVLVQPDFEIFASDHWNFNVRNFNPGGNHGAFFHQSTHSVLMFSGAGIPAGLNVERPYDSLSFVPTILGLMGKRLGEGALGGEGIAEILK